MRKFFNLIRNKYFISTAAFLTWMLFFDRNDLLSQYEYSKQVNELEQEKAFYTSEIEKVSTEIREISTDKKMLEKFAREKYHMKKEDEDVFVIVKEESKTKSLF